MKRDGCTHTHSIYHEAPPSFQWFLGILGFACPSQGCRGEAPAKRARRAKAKSAAAVSFIGLCGLVACGLVACGCGCGCGSGCGCGCGCVRLCRVEVTSGLRCAAPCPCLTHDGVMCCYCQAPRPTSKACWMPPKSGSHTHTPPWAVYTSTITSSLPTTCRRLVVHTVRTSRRQNRVQLMQRPNTHHRLVVTGPISGVTVSRSLRRGTGGPG